MKNQSLKRKMRKFGFRISDLVIKQKENLCVLCGSMIFLEVGLDSGF